MFWALLALPFSLLAAIFLFVCIYCLARKESGIF